LNSSGASIAEAKTGNGSELTFTIENKFLVSGKNALTLRGGFEGCNVQLFPNPVTFHYTDAITVSSKNEITACQNSPLTLQATGAPENGFYNWFSPDGRPIPDANDSVFVIQNAAENAVYAVSAVDRYGCESATTSIHVNPITTALPAITESHDTLFIDAVSGYSYQWKRQGEDIDLATNPFLVPLDSGDYTVVAFNAGCTAESSLFSFTLSEDSTGEDDDSGPGGKVVSIDPDLPHELAMDVYPIPSNGTNLNVRIQSPYKEVIQIKLIATTGQLFYDHSHYTAEVMHGLVLTPDRSLHNGVYMIIVSQGIHEIRKKLIIKH
jgi:hypothetical protein